ncbi:hypothetical protein L1987_60467 [Smallanthus sonchifolius]|uniref:Uncharacterized protein n=1 Tax=Smallanthus sonchifolius TaxID=185202 RepID=A0ACB9D897_9ASTR|nr:hypothetical protein L1987_60467 [Smallanthus sonchifolius]
MKIRNSFKETSIWCSVRNTIHGTKFSLTPKLIHNIFYVPSLNYNILCLEQIMKQGFEVYIQVKTCNMRDMFHVDGTETKSDYIILNDDDEEDPQEDKDGDESEAAYIGFEVHIQGIPCNVWDMFHVDGTETESVYVILNDDDDDEDPEEDKDGDESEAAYLWRYFEELDKES